MTTHEILLAAQSARQPLALASTDQKNAALEAMAVALVAAGPEILAANRLDLDAARGKVSEVMLDRLALTNTRLADMAKGMREVAALPDPVGTVLHRVVRPNGLLIEKTAVPMGVIAIIYESRPNVTSDAAALAIKAGSACVLRCGRDAWRSCNAIVAALRQGLAGAGLPETAVSLIEDTTHASANELMTADGLVDLLIPRGGKGLISACVANATVPCIQTGTGICHVYVDRDADLEMARRHCGERQNQPSQRLQRGGGSVWCTGMWRRSSCPCCGSGWWKTGLPHSCLRWSCVWTAGPRASLPGPPPDPRILTRNFSTIFWQWAWWNSLEDAIEHIGRHSTHHSDAIVTENRQSAGPVCLLRGQRSRVCERLSTRFTDGGEFRPGLRDGHLHPEAPRPRSHGPGRAVHLQVHHPRQRAGARRRRGKDADPLRLSAGRHFRVEVFAVPPCPVPDPICVIPSTRVRAQRHEKQQTAPAAEELSPPPLPGQSLYPGG